MAFDSEKREAAYLLRVLEDGTLSTSDVVPLYEAADPALVAMLIGWLRSRYRNHPAAEGVLGRIVELLSASPTVAQRARQGEADAIAVWFRETHDYRDFDRDAFVDLVIDKLEG